jgi:hypothetical protein
MHPVLIKVRKFTILTHRWMGVVFCVLFFMWFVSGIVMMYTDYPVLGNENRVAHLPAIDLLSVKTSVSDALRVTGVRKPEQVILSSLKNRPVYRVRIKGEIKTVFADTGCSSTGEANRRGSVDRHLKISSLPATLEMGVAGRPGSLCIRHYR